MANSPFHWDITADDAQFKSALASAASSLQATAQQMQGQFTQVFGKIQTMVVGIGAVLAGGSVFGAAIQKSVEMTKEAERLGRQFGISATEAGALAIALKDIDQTTDTLSQANNALTRTLRDDEGAIQKLGVATRDSNGHFRNQLDIMLDVNKRLLEFTEGTDRNVEGSKIYKKAWADVEPLLKLTTGLMEDAKKKAEALGVVVGEQNVEQMHRYNAAMHNVHLVLDAVQKAVADGVMPVLTELGNWFSDAGPERVRVMSKAMSIIIAAFYGLKTAAQIVWETLTSGFAQYSVLIWTIADTADRALHLDFSGAKEAWNRGMEQFFDIGNHWFDEIVKEAEVNRDKIFAALYKGFEGTAQTPTKRKPGDDEESETNKATMAGFEAELAARRDRIERDAQLEGSFRQLSKADEAAFWQEKIAETEEGSQLRAQVTKKYYDAEREVRKQAFESEMQGLKNQIEEHKKSSAARIDLANQVYVATVQKFGRMSKEAQAALGELQRVYREYFDEQRKLQQLAADQARDYHLHGVELAKANVETLHQLGQLTNTERLQALKELSEAEYQIKLAAAEHDAELYIDDEVAYREHLAKIEQLKQQHQVQMAQIDGQIRVESFRVWRDIGSAITSAFSTAIQGVIMGTQTLTQAFRKMGQSVLLALLDMAARWVAQQIIDAAIGKAIDKEKSAVQISDAAAVAAANAFASIAAIPIVGPFMAPEAAAVAYAAAMSWQGALASAAKGFDVPAGLNPYTQLHAREMVLPEPLAEGVRDMVAGGGARGGDVHFHVHSPDVGGMRRWLQDNSNVLVPALRNLTRRNA